jgi:hypothetical protein
MDDQPAEHAPDSPDGHPDLVVVTGASSVAQADMIAAVFQAEGIDAVVYDANISTWMPHWQSAIHSQGIPIAVPSDQLSQAREILARRADAEDDDESAPPVSRADLLARRAFFLSLFCVIPLFIPVAVVSLLQACFVGAGTPADERKEFTPYFVFALVFLFAGLFLLRVLWFPLRLGESAL